jgi:hypothetical protein
VDDEDSVDMQWTVEASAAYERRAHEFLECLERHVAQTLGRKGRQAELRQYFASTEELRTAAGAFDNAEFDWCGSFPLGIQDFEDDEEDEGDEVAPASNGVLTAVGRWDFRITDTDAVVAAGRAAYTKVWPDDTPKDAQERAGSGECSGRDRPRRWLVGAEFDERDVPRTRCDSIHHPRRAG